LLLSKISVKIKTLNYFILRNIARTGSDFKQRSEHSLSSFTSINVVGNKQPKEETHQRTTNIHPAPGGLTWLVRKKSIKKV
jgi:hypothetical protein